MRMTTLATIVSSVLLSAGVAQAGDTQSNRDQFTAADKDGDGSITLAEAQAGMPTLAAKFTTVDTNSDGKVSADEMNAYTKSGGKSMDADQATTPTTSK